MTDKYEIHITNVVFDGLAAKNFVGSDTLKNWFDIKRNYIIDSTPASSLFKIDLNLENSHIIDYSPRNIGELSLVEAAAKYTSPIIFSDDKFFSRISRGIATPINFIADKQTAAFAKIAPIFDNVFPKEVASNYLSHAQTLLSDAKNGVIDAPTLFSSKQYPDALDRIIHVMRNLFDDNDELIARTQQEMWKVVPNLDFYIGMEKDD